MYLSYYGLNQLPFSITPNPSFFYAGSKRGEILEALVYAISHGEGIIKVTGEVGSGKTMLCRMLENMLPSHIEAIYLVNPTLGREEVIYAIAAELKIPTTGKRQDEVIRLLQEDLIAKHAAGRQVVLLVEEAQAMPLETLEEIRLFSNLETAHYKLLQIVLFGQPELDDNLSLPRMRQLKERITHSFTVPPLGLEALPEFLMFRMRAAGYHGPDLFSKGAVKQIHRASEGIVRRISILADKALLAAFADNTHLIEPKHVKAALNDSDFFSPGIKTRYKVAAGVLAAAAVAAIAAFLILPTASLKRSPGTVSGGTVRAPKPAVAAAPVATVPPPAVAEAARPAASTAAASPVPPAAANTPAAAAPATPAPDLLDTQLKKTRDMLAAASPRQYSLQITQMPVSSAAAVRRFIAKVQSELGNDAIYVFPTKADGVARYAIVYGAFATRNEAVAERNRLADEWGYKSQLRTAEGMNLEISSSKSASLWAVE